MHVSIGHSVVGVSHSVLLEPMRTMGQNTLNKNTKTDFQKCVIYAKE